MRNLMIHVVPGHDVKFALFKDRDISNGSIHYLGTEMKSCKVIWDLKQG